MDKAKLYCYVDETGQDTVGQLFIVSVIVPENRDIIVAYLSELEARTGKGKVKWRKADVDKRLQYLEDIFTQREYSLKIYFSIYQDTKEYRENTALTIAKAINCRENIDNVKDTIFTVLVDGLNEKDQRYYGSLLRGLGLHPRKIRGVRKDENDPLIRLADSICGFIRDVSENDHKKLNSLYKSAIEKKVLIEV